MREKQSWGHWDQWEGCCNYPHKNVSGLLWRFCCCSVARSCPTFCGLIDCSTPGFPGIHYVLEFAQTHIHWVDNAIQPFHPLSPPSPLARNLFQHQGLIQWVNSHQVAKVLEFQLESFQWIFSALGLRMIWSPYSSRDSQESSPTSQFESINFQPSAFVMVQLSHLYMTTGKTIALTIWTFVGKVMALLFNTLSRFVIAFFQGANVLISWLQE